MEHLHVLELRLSNERLRLAKAKTISEINYRTVLVDQMNRELSHEKEFIGLEQLNNTLSDDELLMELIKQ
jgi:hypothetical protein